MYEPIELENKAEISQEYSKEETSPGKAEGETSQHNLKERIPPRGSTKDKNSQDNVKDNVSTDKDDEQRPLLGTLDVPPRRTFISRELVQHICVTLLSTIAVIGTGVGLYLLISEARRGEKGWMTKRTDWSRVAYPINAPKLDVPAVKVILVPTNSKRCWDESACIEVLRDKQNIHKKMGIPEIAYNFMIGNDGQLYEGRGWDYLSAFPQYQDDHKHIIVAFIGFYGAENPFFVAETPSTEQIEILHELLNEGYRSRKLLPCHDVTARSDTNGLVPLAADLEVSLRKRFHCYFEG